MGIKTKSIDRIQNRYVNQGSVAGEEYRRSIQELSPEDYSAPTQAAEPIWSANVAKAALAKLFSKGVGKGKGFWHTQSTSIGADRIGGGISAAGGRYNEGFSPFLSVIQALDLGPKRPVGDPANIERVKKIAVALRAKKLQLKGLAP